MGVARVGIGGWTFAPWRGCFYPVDLPQAKELSFAARAFKTLEINGTFYSTFKKPTWEKWRDAAPRGFVFAIKASRYCTHRTLLREAGPAVERFLSQGLSTLGPKLGPINWQFDTRKRFDPEDFAEFLSLLPRTKDGVRLRHAVDVRHPSFAAPAFAELASRHGVAVVYSEGMGVPTIDASTANFRYARLMTTRERLLAGLAGPEIERYADLAAGWVKTGDVFLYMISGAKRRNPAAALALASAIERGRGVKLKDQSTASRGRRSPLLRNRARQ